RPRLRRLTASDRSWRRIAAPNSLPKSDTTCRERGQGGQLTGAVLVTQRERTIECRRRDIRPIWSATWSPGSRLCSPSTGCSVHLHAADLLALADGVCSGSPPRAQPVTWPSCLGRAQAGSCPGLAGFEDCLEVAKLGDLVPHRLGDHRGHELHQPGRIHL